MGRRLRVDSACHHMGDKQVWRTWVRRKQEVEREPRHSLKLDRLHSEEGREGETIQEDPSPCRYRLLQVWDTLAFCWTRTSTSLPFLCMILPLTSRQVGNEGQESQRGQRQRRKLRRRSEVDMCYGVSGVLPDFRQHTS